MATLPPRSSRAFFVQLDGETRSLLERRVVRDAVSRERVSKPINREFFPQKGAIASRNWLLCAKFPDALALRLYENREFLKRNRE